MEVVFHAEVLVFGRYFVSLLLFELLQRSRLIMSRVAAHRIGSLLFCPACGTLLDLPRDDQDEIACAQCGRKEPASCESTLRTAEKMSDMRSQVQAERPVEQWKKEGGGGET